MYNQNYGPGTNEPMRQIPYPQMSPMAPQYPQQGYFQPMQFVYVPDPIAELANCTGVIIRQEPELFEAITSCESANRYHVFGHSQFGEKYLFKCKENSNWCMRNCFYSKHRQFDMDIIHIANADQMQGFTKGFAHAFKPFKFTIWCICRPEMTVSLSDGNVNVGLIKHIFTCCDPEFEVYDGKNQLKFVVSASCCQCGLLCANTLFGKCSEATFQIYTPGTKDIIGTISKMVASGAELASDADSYRINFPANAEPYDKLILIALGLMIDYQYFEQSPADEREERHEHHRHRR